MNILLAFLGWLAWNIGLFSYEKDKYDDRNESFSLGDYAKKFYDNWLLSLVCIPILIIAGLKGLGLDAIPIDDFKHLQWNDLYYLGSGALAEIVKVLIKRISNWKTKQTQ
jgi:hypothetical protein